MGQEERSDPLGVEDEQRKLEHEVPEEGPPVAQMATTHGTVFVTSEEQAEQLADDGTDRGDAPRQGAGRPEPPGDGGPF